MELIRLHPNLIEPTRGSEGAGGYDLYMPDSGYIKEANDTGENHQLIGLGFAAKVPVGCVALIAPRSGAGAKNGIELRNTVGIIDHDYEGEWKVCVKTKEGGNFGWSAGERLYQFVVVPVLTPALQVVEQFSTHSERGTGGFGSTGQ